jgi:DNA repair exonuclease SbcCD ATPase subunit
MRDLFLELNTKQLILVSHEQKIEGFVDHVVKIKKDGTSEIETVQN